MRRALTETEFHHQLSNWRHTALRAELQPGYWVAGERASFQSFLAGQPPSPSDIEGTPEWLRRTAQRTAAGDRLERIRVHQDPPNDYQRWLQVLGEHYLAAGERISYLTEATADKAGLLGVATRDWWFFDDERLMVLTHDENGHRIRAELVDDAAELHRARAWWDLAVRTTREEGP